MIRRLIGTALLALLAAIYLLASVASGHCDTFKVSPQLGFHPLKVFARVEVKPLTLKEEKVAVNPKPVVPEAKSQVR